MTDAGHRHLAAVMFTDIAGYTALMQRDEAAALQARSRHRQALEAAVPAHGGRILQFLGDGSLSVFASAFEAAAAAVEIQQELRREPNVPLRIGIHQGDIAYDAQGVYGDSVNVAARIQALAPAGGVMISGKVWDEIKNQKSLPGVFVAELSLKNVERPVRVFALTAAGLAVPNKEEIRPKPADSKPEHASVRAVTVLAERLQPALAPRYRVERPLASGGMGLVFDAWDTVLRRRVAIKVIRPEFATARAVDRFLREARTLASFRHPNIVTIHDAGEADGLPYYVMDYVEGETLLQRLGRGPLSAQHTVRIGLDVLSGLEAAHARGVVHRDVKPANIFLLGESALLGDFGVAKSREQSGEGTSTSQVSGTAAYMAPEQAAGSAVSDRTDLYALAMVLYEAVTGRHWPMETSAERADWSGCPRPLARVLSRALAWSPEQRWKNASEFRAALHQAQRRPRLGRVLAFLTLAAMGTLVVRIAIWWSPGPATPGFNLAIFPFDVSPRSADSLGVDAPRIAALGLEGLPGFHVVPAQSSFRWWNAHSDEAASSGPGSGARALRALHQARGSIIVQAGDSIEVRITLADSSGGAQGLVIRKPSSADVRVLGDAIALALLEAIHFDASNYRGAQLSSKLHAVIEFLRGENAFQRDAWEAAERNYVAALEVDSAFALAWWRLANVRRWLVRPGATFGLEDLHARYREQLSARDRALLDALLQPVGEDRLVSLDAARDVDRNYAYAALLHGDELLHRGPLSGHGLEEAEIALREATGLDDFLTPAYEHHAWVLIRLGREAEADAVLRRLERLAAHPSEAMSYPDMIRQAFFERFDAANARVKRAGLLGKDTPGYLQRLMFVARAGLSFDVPMAQLETGQELAAHSPAPRHARAHGHQAQAMALLAMGRVEEGLRQLDSAAQQLNTSRARLAAAEWRVIPAALGLDVLVDTTEYGRGLRDLQTHSDSLRARANWTLALAAYGRQDTEAARRWRESLRDAPATADKPAMERLLRAREMASVQRYRSALAIADSLQPKELSDPAGDPFLRAATYVLRAQWHEQVGDSTRADRQWMWAENQDIADWMEAELRSVDVDWVLAPWAAFRRGLLERDLAKACVHFERVERFWSNADEPLRRLAQEVRAQPARCPA